MKGKKTTERKKQDRHMHKTHTYIQRLILTIVFVSQFISWVECFFVSHDCYLIFGVSFVINCNELTME